MKEVDLDPVTARLVELERLSREDPVVAASARDLIIGSCRGDAPWVQRLHVVRLLPRLDLKDADYDQGLAFLFDQAGGSNRFIAAWALDSLATLATSNNDIWNQVHQLLEHALATGSPAIRVRARHGLRRLGANRQHSGD